MEYLILKMKEHKFKPTDIQDNISIYLVKCIKTGGSFYTSIWIKGNCEKNKCPCCNEYIKKKKSYS